MLEYMKLSQLAAFYLGIIFTVISIATTLLAIKYAKKLNSFAKAISLCLIAPFIACTSWLYLVFSYLDGLRKSEILTLFVAILLALFICGMVVIVSKALYSKHGPALEEYDRYMEEQAELAENGETAAETTEEAVEEETENTDNSGAIVPSVAVATLLLNNGENEDGNTIVVDAEVEDVEPLAEEAAEDEAYETAEDVEENVEEVEEPEETEEAEEAPADEETVEESEEVEEPVEETDETTDETEEVEEETTVEEVEETDETEETETAEEETPAEETTDDTDEDNGDDEGDADEEFNKFLEELRKKVEGNGEGEEGNN